MKETIAISPAKSALQFGILFGVIMVLEFMVSYILNIDPISNPTFGLILNSLNYFILPLVLIYIGCTNYKKLNSGFISFGECLKVGVTICLIAGLIYAFFTVVFNLIFPEFIEDILRKTRAVMIEKNSQMTDEQLEMAMSWTRKFMNPTLVVPVTAAMFSFIGLIYSLIIGAVVKKNKPESL